MQPVIEFKEVSFCRESSWLLLNINWQVNPGSDVAILGPNGSGKSTIARIVLGYLWPTSGQVSVTGEQFGQTDLHQLRRHIRMVQPNGPFDLDANLSLLEVVLTGFDSTLVLRKEPSLSDIADAEKMLHCVGLSSQANRKYQFASSGEKVRALIGRAMVSTPKVLILDEPTSGLDLLGREQLLKLIGSIRTEMQAPDLSIVMITHHTEELFVGTSEVLLLNQGRCHAVGKIDEVLTSENLSAVYKFPIRVHREGGRFYTLVRSED